MNTPPILTPDFAKVPTSRPEAVQWLAARRPASVMVSLEASLRQRHNTLKRLRTCVKPGEPDWGMAPVVAGEMDLQGALQRVDASFAAADDGMIAAAVGECAALTVPRNGTSADVVLRAYISRLREYPADVVLSVFKDWPSRSKWFPTWQELETALEVATQPRRDLKAAIEFTLLNGPDKPAEPMQRAPREAPSPVVDIRPQPAPPARTREEQLAALNAMQGA